MEKQKVFLDSNILFSIVYTKNSRKSRFGLFIDLYNRNFFNLYISDFVKNEVTRNVEQKIPSELKNLEKVLKNFNVLKDNDEILNELSIYNLPTEDNIILNTSIKNKMDFFITGNTKDFKNLYGAKIHNCLILRPIDFFELH